MIDPEPNLIPPGHGESAGPGAMPRCPYCGTVIDTYLAAGTGKGKGKGRCPTHGLVVAVYGDRDAIRAARPDYDPHVDHPERYTDGRPV
jgi:hypothetical protein